MNCSVRLAEVVDINPRQLVKILSDEEIAFVAMADVSEDGLLISSTIRPYSEVVTGYTPFARGDILLAKITPCFENGKSCLTNNLPKSIGFGSTEFHVLRPTERINSQYLHHLVRSGNFRLSGQRRMTGSAGQKRVPTEFIRNYQINIPTLKDQYRIVTLLDKADAIRKKRREALKLADEFLRSVFLDMFGDPVTNPKGWATEKFANLGNLERGKSRHRPRDDAFLYGGPYPFIQTGDIANSEGVIEQYQQTYSELGLQQSRLWPKGTLCITIAANIGKTGILGFDACFPDSVVGFTGGKGITPEFVQFWLNEIQGELERAAPQVAQKNINLEILSRLDTPVPPLKEQQLFSRIVAKVRAMKLTQRHARDESDLLFASLSEKVFAG